MWNFSKKKVQKTETVLERFPSLLDWEIGDSIEIAVGWLEDDCATFLFKGILDDGSLVLLCLAKSPYNLKRYIDCHSYQFKIKGTSTSTFGDKTSFTGQLYSSVVTKPYEATISNRAALKRVSNKHNQKIREQLEQGSLQTVLRILQNSSIDDVKRFEEELHRTSKPERL